ncbi:beta-N-acetylhexosaminidase, partial [bacterium]|nr:beta-N-acetylhexosaminidase [bacterium]
MKIHISGGKFKITSETVIIVDNNTSKEGKYLSEIFSSASGFNLNIKQVSQQKPGNNCIKLIISPEETYLGEEGYKLSVQSDGVVIEAPKLAGIFYGIQTLQQLLPLEIEPHKRLNDNIICSIPCVEIEDKPRFKWRGLMIDCSRTFWSKEYIKRYISLLSRYKMNRLHLHLTDDQGWRIEIKKHPKLTEVGSKFAKKYNEPPEREGYYSQDDIREIIAYGAKHNVTIVPEIEMPGHSTAALAVYPELSCTGGPFEIYPFFKGPHVTKDVLCAGNEKTFKFLEEVITEVAKLFPSEFIHIGGDEVPK